MPLALQPVMLSIPTARTLLALSLALVLPACTDKDEGGTADTDAGTDTDAAPTTGDDDPPAVGCECAASEACSVSLCPTLEYTEDETMEPPADSAELASAVTCALEALRDGKTGSISWTSYLYDGQFSTYGRFELFGDGTGRRGTGGSEDLCFYETDMIVVGPLHPTTHFADCLAETDVGTRYDCVVDALASPGSVCQAGEQNCDGI